MKKKALALVLVLCMALSMLPVTAFAAQPKPAPQVGTMMVPRTVGELETASVSPNASSYSVTLTSSGRGEAELLVSSPAKVGSEVYFVANPDDGYLAEIYYEGLSSDALVYVGGDVVGFIMPANKVKLTVKFVAAQGEEHHIAVFDNGRGEYALSRGYAKEYESVLLAIKPDNNAAFKPMEYVWCPDATMFYLFEEQGVHYFEIIMSDKPALVFFCYKYSSNPIQSVVHGGFATVTTNVQYAGVNDLVTATIIPDPGYRLIRAEAQSSMGHLVTELTPIGNNQYTFRVHPSTTDIHVWVEPILNNVTVKAGVGGTAKANVTQAKIGDTVTVTCTPDQNYRVYSVTGVQGIQDKGNNVYTFTMPGNAVTVNVAFRKIYNPVNLTVETGLGGSAITNVTEAKQGDVVTLTCTPDEGYRIARIAGVKDLVDNGNGTYTFTMPDEAVELKVLFLRHENPFLDVNETQFFYTPVLWAVEEGITAGLSTDSFGPFSVCNRAQVVTFLWRAAGCPEPSGTENPFTDVAAGSFYERAVLWAVEKGITAGLTADTFGPNAPCNRAQVVTFLYRARNARLPEGVENPFEDVDEKDFYYAPVLWALENGVTAGSDATHFNPNGQCQRAQVVTFLYRAKDLPVAYDLHSAVEGEGTVTLSHTAALAGETVTVTATPAEGWVLDSIWCENGTELTQISDTEYTFTMPGQEEIVHASFLFPEEPPVDPEIPVEPEIPTDPTDPVDPDPEIPVDPEF